MLLRLSGDGVRGCDRARLPGALCVFVGALRGIVGDSDARDVVQDGFAQTLRDVWSA